MNAVWLLTYIEGCVSFLPSQERCDVTRNSPERKHETWRRFEATACNALDNYHSVFNSGVRTADICCCPNKLTRLAWMTVLVRNRVSVLPMCLFKTRSLKFLHAWPGTPAFSLANYQPAGTCNDNSRASSACKKGIHFGNTLLLSTECVYNFFLTFMGPCIVIIF